MPNRQSSVISRQLSDKKRLALSDPAKAGESKGFTLVELLVTIAIIAILSAIGLVAYSMVLKQGRDSKRMSDLRTIQSALEQYFSDQGYYPYANKSLITGSSYNGLDDQLAISSPQAFTNQIGTYNTVSVTKTYMNTLPQDPDPTKRYAFRIITNRNLISRCNNYQILCTKYCIYAKLDKPPDSGIGSCPALSPYNYAVIPPI